jgi:prevent-host-death family protein
MAIDIIPISEAKKNLSAVVSEVEKENKVYCIARNSRAAAMLVGIKGYNRLLERLEDLEDVRDMLEAQKEPGRSFEEYLANREKRGA